MNAACPVHKAPMVVLPPWMPDVVVMIGLVDLYALPWKLCNLNFVVKVFYHVLIVFKVSGPFYFTPLAKIFKVDHSKREETLFAWIRVKIAAIRASVWKLVLFD
jgi:hypothetical protein